MAPKKAATATAPATKKATAKPTKAAVVKKAPAAKPAAKPPIPEKPVANTTRKRKTKDEYDVDQIGEEPEQPKTKAGAALKKTATAKVTVEEKKAAPVTKKTALAKKPAAKKPTAAKKSAVPAKKATPAPEDDKENAKPAALKVNGKRKREEDEESEETPEEAEEKSEEPPVKKTKTAAAAKKAASPKPTRPKITFPKIGVKINSAPDAVLQIFVMGEGSSGELGMGSKRIGGKMPIDVKRPRLNPLLSSKDVGVVQIACGGMHAVALTKDNKILTWGVNDQGALGRETTWDGGLRDADAPEDEEDEDDDDDDDTGVNPRESTPTEVNTSGIAPGTKFVQVVASDSASFALTEDGRVYGWGTFRASDGVLGFSPEVSVQMIPTLLPEPKKVVQLACGSNHVMALDNKGKVLTWGCPEQNQLGRRCVLRDIKESALRPGGVGLKRGVHVQKLACGSYHSFALDKKGQVYAWGLNNFGELAIEEGAGEDDACVLEATYIKALSGHKIIDIVGGEHHSLACTDDGKVITWGRVDGGQCGVPKSYLNHDNAIYDARGFPRILMKPTVLEGVSNAISVAAGTDNSFALTSAGQAYSWGFSTNYQTGQGTTDDIETPALVDNSAVRDKKLVYAGCGGQFSILASVDEDTPMTNGVNGAN
ncbi:Protein pim1 [Pleurostoma richardsiae]|uniref:Protein pim1 n=1 Tax=Pleurostoma richardsiae TaxID=41990 RepID=A0AA38RAR6_9PEZI|nr:Protein pim1 [Pleurostoma richardsiae]